MILPNPSLWRRKQGSCVVLNICKVDICCSSVFSLLTSVQLLKEDNYSSYIHKNMSRILVGCKRAIDYAVKVF